MAVIITIGIFSGLALLLYGVFFVKSQDNDSKESPEAVNMIKQSVEEADATLSNINSVSSLIIEEMDIKYKELLFLYQMMEEKKKEIVQSRLLPSNENKMYYEETVYFPNNQTANTYDYNQNYGPNYTHDYMQNYGQNYAPGIDIVENAEAIMDMNRSNSKFRNREAILDMYAKNYDVTYIARKLGMGKGEVQLIIGLNKAGAGGE